MQSAGLVQKFPGHQNIVATQAERRGGRKLRVIQLSIIA